MTKDKLYEKILENRKEANYKNFNRETIKKTIEENVLSDIKEILHEIDNGIIKAIGDAVLPQDMRKISIQTLIGLEDTLQKELDLRLKVKTEFKGRRLDKSMDMTLLLLDSQGICLDNLSLELKGDFMRESIGDFLNENSTLKDFVDFTEVTFNYKEDKNPFNFTLNYYYDTTPSVKEG